MKILYVVHQFLPRNVAGTEVYTYRLAKEMQREHEVCLLFSEVEPERTQYETEPGTFDGLPFTRMTYNYHVERFDETWSDPAAEAVFLEVLEREQPDLVHFQHLQAFGVGLPVIARAHGLPLVYTLHEYAGICPAGGQMILPTLERCDGPGPESCGACIRYYALPTPEESGLPADRIPAAEAERRARAFLEMTRGVSLFISPSRFLRDVFVRAGYPADRFIATDNGFDVSPFEGYRRRPSETLRFGYVGAMVPYKGIHVLVEAFNEMSEDGWELHIHGGVREDSPHAPYQSRIREMASDARIQVHGAFRPDEVAKVFEDVDVLIVPSLWVENSPLTIHEAFVCGAPVITANLGGMAELVQDGVNGLLFEPGNATSLRACARRLLEDRGLVERLREGIPHVKTIAEHAVEMNEIYESLEPIPLVGEEERAMRETLAGLPERARARRERERARRSPAAEPPPQPPAEEHADTEQARLESEEKNADPPRRPWWKWWRRR